MSNPEKAKTIKTWIEIIAIIFVLGGAWATFGERLVRVEGTAKANGESITAAKNKAEEQFKAIQVEQTVIKLDVKEIQTKQDIVMENQKEILKELRNK